MVTIPWHVDSPFPTALRISASDTCSFLQQELENSCHRVHMLVENPIKIFCCIKESIKN